VVIDNFLQRACAVNKQSFDESTRGDALIKRSWCPGGVISREEILSDESRMSGKERCRERGSTEVVHVRMHGVKRRGNRSSAIQILTCGREEIKCRVDLNDEKAHTNATDIWFSSAVSGGSTRGEGSERVLVVARLSLVHRIPAPN
jgi:hypothetical protein